MFVHEAVSVSGSLGDAKKRLHDVVDSAHDLQTASSAAFTHGMDLLSPDGDPAATPTIIVQHLPPYVRGDTAVVPLRWCVPGESADSVAPLDANLELRPDGEGLSRLALIGSFRPRQSPDTVAFDRALVDIAARSTCHMFLNLVSHLIAPPCLDPN